MTNKNPNCICKHLKSFHPDNGICVSSEQITFNGVAGVFSCLCNKFVADKNVIIEPLSIKRLHNKPRFDKSLFNSQYVAALKAVNSFFNDYKKSKVWMLAVNPLLGNVSPYSMVRLGRFDKLMTFIYTQIEENGISK